MTVNHSELQSRPREQRKTAYRIWIIIRKRVDVLEKSTGTTNTCLCVYVCVANYPGYKYTPAPSVTESMGGCSHALIDLRCASRSQGSPPAPSHSLDVREKPQGRTDEGRGEVEWRLRSKYARKKKKRAGINKTVFRVFFPPSFLLSCRSCRCVVVEKSRWWEIGGLAAI